MFKPVVRFMSSRKPLVGFLFIRDTIETIDNHKHNVYDARVIKLKRVNNMGKENKTLKKNKAIVDGATDMLQALAVLTVLISMGYCAFVTIYLAEGSRNVLLAAPSVIAIGGTILFVVFNYRRSLK